MLRIPATGRVVLCLAGGVNPKPAELLPLGLGWIVDLVDGVTKPRTPMEAPLTRHGWQRVARRLALAYRFEWLIRTCDVPDNAELGWYCRR